MEKEEGHIHVGRHQEMGESGEDEGERDGQDKSKESSKSSSDSIGLSRFQNTPVKISLERLSHSGSCEKHQKTSLKQDEANEAEDPGKEELVQIDVIDEDSNRDKESCQCESNPRIVLFGGADPPEQENMQNEYVK